MKKEHRKCPGMEIKMLGIYFSGTGNTRFCVEYIVSNLDKSAKVYSIENSEAMAQIAEQEEIILGYPVYYSNIPKIVRDYIEQNRDIWAGKKIYLVATMGLFSGDGTGVAARILKKYGAVITGGLHLKMPDCVGDVKLLKKSLEQNVAVVNRAKKKMEHAVIRYRQGTPTQQGLGIFSRVAGLVGQRLYFQGKVKEYSDKLKIDTEKCIGCGQCSKLCPMQNISMEEKKAVQGNQCTMCYRCISHCPVQAITLIGKEVIEQSRIEKYIQ